MITKKEITLIAQEVVKLLNANNAIEQADDETYLNANEAAEYLRCTRATIYRKLTEIPHIRKDKRLYFPLSKLKGYLNSHTE